jgi:trk system potassium uptake protein
MLGALFLVSLSAAALFTVLIPSILIALADGDNALALDMVFFGSVGAFIAIMVLTAISNRVHGLDRELNYVGLLLLWIFTPLIAALSFMVLAGIDFMPAWFEAVSALTTSGGSVLARDVMPDALLFWRSSLEWYGGFLTLISIIYVLAPAGFGGLRARGRNRGQGSQRDGWDSVTTYSSILMQYTVLTLIVCASLIFTRVEPFEAFMLGMMSISTGGFLPFTEPLEERVPAGAIFVLALGFVFGTLSIFWRRNILRNPRRLMQDNSEAAIVLAMIAFLTIVYAVLLVNAAGRVSLGQFGMTVLESFFTAASLVATSGIETRPGVIGLVPVVFVLVIILVGASVYSTSGGLKIYRIATMWIYAAAEINRLIYPAGVTRRTFDGAPIAEQSIRAVWSYFSLALLSIAVATVLLTFSAPADFESGLAMAIALFASAGPAYDALRPATVEISIIAGEVSGWPTFAQLPYWAYVPAVVVMTIGRLEVLIVFAVINLRYWLNR